MEVTRSNQQATRQQFLILVAFLAFAFLQLSALLAPEGAWYIPTAGLFGVTAILLWVNAQDVDPVSVRAEF